MATYFHGGSEIQADGLQTLYLMNPGYIGYSDTQQQPNMVFLNSAGNTMNLSQPPQQQNHQQHFVGIPLQATPISPSSSQQNPNRQSVHSQQHEMSAIQGFIPRVQYNLWTQIDQSSHQHQQQQQQQNSPTISSLGVNNSISVGDVSSQLGLRRSVVTPSQQGLSLSLSSQQPGYGPYQTDSDIQASAAAPVISPTSGEDMRVSGGSSSSASGMSNGTSNMQSVLLGSKYLKAAQQLLDEVVNVGKGIKTELSKGTKEQINISKELSSTATGDGSTGGESIAKQGADLTTTEKQELQMKKAKLVSMLDEVEQRYRQYHHQMQIVVSSFEQAAGFGSAKTYTALALQTISKQFRCLKDAISGQIRATSKSLGEDDCLGSGKGEGSRLRFVDHQLRQQRALQQLGMIQHNAWRPQRGLPERSVSILRAWLFEHFLHPYPKDSDKLMLAKQTGLTRSQVSNWFINARVRLWKPMVEEMYMEETKDHEQNGMEEKSKNESKEESGSKSNTHQENSPTRTDQTRNFNSNQDSSTEPNAPPTSMSNSTIQTSTMEENMRAQAGFFLNFEGMTQGSNKKSRNTDMQNSPTSFQSIEMDMKPNETDSHRDLCRFGNERQNRDGYSLIASTPGGFGAYSMGEMGRFDPDQFAPRFAGNGVSLTLGLPHCENLSLSGAQQNYLSNQNIQLGRGLEMSGAEQTDFCGISTQQASPTTYENINMQNRKRFAAQLLPDFVA